MILAAWDSTFCVRVILTLGHFLWQGAAIALIAALTVVLLRRRGAQLRYLVLVTALLLMGACPPVTFSLVNVPSEPMTQSDPLPHAPIADPDFAGPSLSDRTDGSRAPARYYGPESGIAASQSEAPVAVVTGSPDEISPAANVSPRKHPWQRWNTFLRKSAPHLTVIYLVGVAAMVGRLILGLRGGRRLRKVSRPVDDPTLLQALTIKAKQLGLHFIPAIAYCKQTVVPTVIGVLRPIILLPVSLATALTPDQIEAILGHELAHIRRHDHLVNILQRIIESLLFFHPGVWFVSRRIRIERENCCDDLALATGGKRLSYATSLVQLAEASLKARKIRRFIPAAALAAASKPSQLRLRILRLLSGSSPKHETLRLSRTWPIALVLVATVLLAASMFTDLAAISPTEPAAKDVDSSGRDAIESVTDLAASPLPALSAVPKELRLAPGDVVEISVLHLFRLGREATFRRQVSAKGLISLPLLPEPIKVQGLTHDQLRGAVVRAYSAKGLSNPSVSVMIPAWQRAFPGYTPGIRANEALSFGPVTELVVNDNGVKEDFLVDLDAGKLVDPPPDLEKFKGDPEGVKRMLRSTGIDAMGTVKPDMLEGLLGFDMVVIPASEVSWQRRTPAAVIREVALGDAGFPTALPGKRDGRATFVFRTREGGMGLLQIIGFTDNPPAVKIRYKMVKSGDPDRARPDSTVQSDPTSLSRGRTMELRVVHKETGKPLAGVTLRLTAKDDSEVVRDSTVSTDETGRARIDLPRERFKYFSIQTSKNGFVPMKATWGPMGRDPLPDRYTLRVLPATTIGGVIQNEEGKPIEGATVTLRLEQRPDLQTDENVRVYPVYISEKKVKTDKSGRWKCDFAPADLDKLTIYLQHPDYLSDFLPGFDWGPPITPRPPIRQLRDLTSVMIMKRGKVMTGKVVDEDGKPIAGAAVSQIHCRLCYVWGAIAHTDSKGHFHIRYPKPGRRTLAVVASGYTPQMRQIALREGLPSVTFRMTPGRSIRGRIVDDQGKPIPSALVSVVHWDGIAVNFLRLGTKTGADGRFHLADAPSGDVRFNIDKSSYMRLIHFPMSPGKKEYEITLKPSLRISGSVIDAETRKPIPRFDVATAYARGDGRAPWRTIAGAVTRGWHECPRQTFVNGRYELDFQLEYGNYQLRVQGKDYKPAVSRLFKTSEANRGAVIYNFELEKIIPAAEARPSPRSGSSTTPASVENTDPGHARVEFRKVSGVSGKKTELKVSRGTVRDQRGAPVSNAQVVLYYRRSRWGLDNRIVETVWSDQVGRFQFKSPLTYKSYILIAIHPDHAFGWRVLLSGEEQPPHEVVLTEPQVQDFRVTDAGGEPIEGARVWLYGAGGRTDVNPAFRSYLSIPEDLKLIGATTDADGRATVTNLPKTGCSFQASHSGYADAYVGGVLPPEQEKMACLFRGGTVSGTVRNPEGKGVSDAVVWFRANWRLYCYWWAKTDSAGRFKIDTLVPRGGSFTRGGGTGGYRVQLQHERYTTRETQVQVQEPGEVIDNFDLEAEPGTLILGRVVEPGTLRPLPGARVQGFTRSGRVNAYADQMGEFRWRVIPGEATFFFLSPPKGLCILNPDRSEQRLSVEGDQMPLTIHAPGPVHPAVSVRGRVVMPDGSPARGVRVYATSSARFLRAGGGGIPRTNTDSNGSFKLDAVPAEQRIMLYAEADQRKWVGATEYLVPDSPKGSPLVLRLEPSTSASVLLRDEQRQVQSGAQVDIRPIVSGKRISSKRTAYADEKGYLKLDGILPGLQYEITHGEVDRKGPRFKRVTVVLAPKGERKDSPEVVLSPVDVRAPIRLVEPPSLLGKALPSLEKFKPNLPPGTLVGKSILVCFWDMNQRPSRHCIQTLAKTGEHLASKDVVVVAVHTGSDQRESLQAWMKKNNVRFPVGQVPSDAKTRQSQLDSWCVRGLPWLILTDSKHIVRAEGFSVDELSEKLTDPRDSSKTRGTTTPASPAKAPSPSELLKKLSALDAAVKSGFTVTGKETVTESRGSRGESKPVSWKWKMTMDGERTVIVSTVEKTVQPPQRNVRAFVISGRDGFPESRSSSAGITVKRTTFLGRELGAGIYVSASGEYAGKDPSEIDEKKLNWHFRYSRPNNPWLNLQRRQAMWATGRGYSEVMDNFTEVKVGEDGKLLCKGVGKAFIWQGRWELVIDAKDGYIVRSAKFFRDDRDDTIPSIEVETSGTFRFNGRAVARSGRWVYYPGSRTTAMRSVETASYRPDREFADKVEKSLFGPFPGRGVIDDQRLSAGSIRTFRPGYEYTEDAPVKIPGVIRDPQGKPAGGVLIRVFPGGEGQLKSDEAGRFHLFGRLERRRTVMLFAWDPDRDLAGAVGYRDPTEPIDLTLTQATTLTGRVLDPEGHPVAGMTISPSVLIGRDRTGRGINRGRIQTDEQGRYEIPCLPSGQRYQLSAQGTGYGPKWVNLPAATPGRMELGTILLHPANLSVSGVVVDADGKPIPDAEVYLQGGGQPHIDIVKADWAGKFWIEGICKGEITLRGRFAGKTGSVKGLAGDTDVKLVIPLPRGPRAGSLVGGALPRLEIFNLGPGAPETRGKRVLVCFWDMNQRPSRHCIQTLAKIGGDLTSNNVVVVAVHAGSDQRESLQAWMKKNNVRFPVGGVQGDAKKRQRQLDSWCVQGLPWLILTDRQHIVQAEGFGVSELSEKLKEITEKQVPPASIVPQRGGGREARGRARIAGGFGAGG